MKKLAYIIIASLLLGCGGGGGGGGSSNPPSVDVTGTWLGNYNSSVFASESMTMNLQQVGASVTGTYSSSTGGLGSVSASVSDYTLSGTITVTTPGCSGSFHATGVVTVPPVGHQTMSFSYNGSSTCGGAESGTGTLTLQSAPPLATTDITGTYRMTEYLDLYVPSIGQPYNWSHTPNSFSGTMTVGPSTFSQIIYLDITNTSPGMKYTGTGSYTIYRNAITLHNVSYTIQSVSQPTSTYPPLTGASDGWVTMSDNILTTYSGEYPEKVVEHYTEKLYFYWTRE